jgi:hypothetical protein
MNKRYLFLTILGLGLIFSCQKDEKEAGIITETFTEIPGNYGKNITVDEITNSVEMISKVETEGTFEGKISGEIKEVCTKKGCWMTMSLPNGESMRVTFKDYGFFIPIDSQGFPVVLEGVATLTETDVATLQHFAEDQGKSVEEIAAITEPKREITFEATGVVIKAKA